MLSLFPTSVRLMFLLLGLCFLIGIFTGCDYGDDDAPSTSSGQADDDDTVDDDDTADDDDDDASGCQSGKELTFDLSSGNRNIPFPSMILTKTDPTSSTGIRLNFEDQTVTYLDEVLNTVGFMFKDINKVEGFSVIAPVWFQTNVAPDMTQFPQYGSQSIDDPVFCAVLEDESHPHYGEVWGMDFSFLDDMGLIQAHPHFPFAQNTTYACVITDKFLTADGECYQTPKHLRYVMRESGDPQNSDYQLLEPSRKLLAPYFKELFSQYEISPDNIVGATVFHTQWITHDLLHARDQLEEMDFNSPPQVGDWERIEISLTNIDSVWETTYETFDFRNNGVFAHDENGDPQITGTMTITLRLYLPIKGINGHDGPFPVVLYAHGINDDRTQARQLAQTLAGYGFATASIDLLYHGARSQGADQLPWGLDSVVESLRMINFFRPLVFRDNFKQGTLDYIWLKHVIRSLNTLDLLPYETEGDSEADLDTENIFFAGMSLGSITGGIIAAVEPDLKGFLFNVGAVNWQKIGLEGPVGEIIFDVLGLIDGLVDIPLVNFVNISFELFKIMAEAGDPYTYAVHVLKEPLYDIPDRTVNILHQMGAYDETLGGPGCSEMTRSMGLTLLRPYVYQIDDVEISDAPFNGPATFMYDTGEHSMMLRGSATYFDAVHLQAGTFFRTAVDNGTATIINPLE